MPKIEQYFDYVKINLSFTTKNKKMGGKSSYLMDKIVGEVTKPETINYRT